MPTQNIISVDSSTDRSEVLLRQPSRRVAPLVYDTSTKGLYIRDVKNALTLTVFDSSSDLQASAAGVVGLKADLMQRAYVTVTAAQIKTLNTVPTTVLASPGAGLAIVLDQVIFNLVFGTTQMASGGVVSVTYTGQATNLLAGTLAANQITSATSTRNSIYGLATQSALLTATGLDIKAATGDFTTGDSVLNLILYYTVVALT